MDSKLVLIRADNQLSPLTTGVLYEVAAAKYVKLDLGRFRDLVKTGRIPARVHEGRKRRIYLKEDLDVYLRNLLIVNAGESKIPHGEVPPQPPFPQEVSSGR